MLFLCVKKSSQGKDAWFSLSLLEDVSFPFFPLNFTCLMKVLSQQRCVGHSRDLRCSHFACLCLSFLTWLGEPCTWPWQHLAPTQPFLHRAEEVPGVLTRVLFHSNSHLSFGQCPTPLRLVFVGSLREENLPSSFQHGNCLSSWFQMAFLNDCLRICDLSSKDSGHGL